jgi:invasion protein IalB
VRRMLSIATSLAAIAAGPSFAQTGAPAQSQPVSAVPESTTATYGAWTLRCSYRQEGGARTHFCEVEQAVVPQGQQTPIAQIGVGRLSPKDEMRLTVVLPTNIAFRYAPRVTAQDKDPGVVLTWERCVPGGCIADAMLKDDVLKAWRATAADTGRLLFTNAGGQNIAIEFTFRGFAQAMDAFGRERS